MSALKNMADLHKQLRQERALTKELTKRGRQWMALAKRREKQVKHLKLALQVTTDKLQITREGHADEFSTISTRVRKRRNELLAALFPFAKFGKRLMDGRSQVPQSGAWYGLDSGCETEATLDIEHFKRAIELVDGRPMRILRGGHMVLPGGKVIQSQRRPKGCDCLIQHKKDCPNRDVDLYQISTV